MIATGSRSSCPRSTPSRLFRSPPIRESDCAPSKKRRVAAIRYSGFWSRSRYDDHERKLREWIDQRGLEPISEPVWARYDPPFMPWFLRRNEVVIEVREPGTATAREEPEQ